ncbi:MAG: hypothetical protein ACC628_09545 [Pirellulaceae bacterium]
MSKLAASGKASLNHSSAATWIIKGSGTFFGQRVLSQATRTRRKMSQTPTRERLPTYQVDGESALDDLHGKTMAKRPSDISSEPPAQRSKQVVWITPLFLIFLACFWAWFYFGSNDDLARHTRIARLSWVLFPDQLMAEWVGKDISRFGPWDRVHVVLPAGLILTLACFGGRLIMDLLPVKGTLTRLETSLISIGLGLNLLSLLTLTAGLTGMLHTRWWLVSAAICVAFLSARRWRAWRATAWPVIPAERDLDIGTRRWVQCVLWCCLPFVVLIVLGGMMRPWHFDVREYHLQIPKEWYHAGSIGFVPHNIYGNMPLGAEMHALLAMVAVAGEDAWWWGAIAGKLVIATHGPLAALAVFATGRRFASPLAGAVAALIYISTPWVAHVSMAGLIDGVSAFYFILTFHVAILWTQQRKTDPETPASIWGLPAVAGLLAGAAVSCKYPALLFLVAPITIWMVSVAGGPLRWKGTAVFLVATAIACGPWFGKNWILTGNPTYPLLYPWFDGKTRTPEKDAQWRKAHQTPVDSEGRPRLSLEQLRSSLELLAGRSEYASPLLVPLALWAVFSQRHRRFALLLLGMCAYMFAVWWLLTHRVDRFMLPALPFAALIAGFGATWSDAVLWRRSVAIALGFCLVPNLVLVASRGMGDNRFLVSLAELRADQPHESDYDEETGYYYIVHPSHGFLNKTVEPGFRVLAVGEAQVFDLEVPVLYNTCFDDGIFEKLMRGRTRNERYEALRKNRISHILFYWSELERYRSPGNYGYSDYVTRKLIWQEFVEEQQILRNVPAGTRPQHWEIFEVIGWQKWEERRMKDEG